MRLLTEEEMGLLEWESGTLNMAFIDNHKAEVKALNEAQRDLTHKETLKAVIKDLEMIMKEAPDLKSLEKMIAGYITERRGEMPEEVK